MLCCGCNEIVMGKQSAIGPIDPQFFVPTQAGGKWVAGQLLQDEFKRAQVEVKADPASGQAWYPILTQYPPGILQQVTIATRLGRDQVKTWLDKYMFASDEVKKGQEIGDFLSNHASHLSHSRRIDRDVARAKGMKVVDLEEDNDLQDLVLSVFHLTSHLFGMTPVYKIIENQNGKAYLRMSGPPPPY